MRSSCRRRAAVVRYDSDGTLDTSFGNGAGYVLPIPPTFVSGTLRGVAIQPDNQIVAAGSVSNNGTDTNAAVIRLNATDGTFDTTFDHDGIATTPILQGYSASSMNGSAMALQADGKILVSEKVSAGNRELVGVARFNPNGSLDDFGPSLSITDVSKPEGNRGTTAFTFTVSLSQSSSTPVTVQYSTENGTAVTTKGSVDYTATSGTLTIPAGKTTGTVTVSVKGDTTVEPDETFYLLLYNASPGVAFAKAVGTGTILNDDGRATIASPASAGPTGTALGATVLSAPAAAPAQALVVQPGTGKSGATASTLVFNAVAQTAGTTAPSTVRDTQGLQLQKRDDLAVDAALQDLDADLLADELASVLVP